MVSKTQCIHCGYDIELDDPDFIYPSNRERTKWTIHCPSCGVWAECDSIDECMEIWDFQPHLMNSD